MFARVRQCTGAILRQLFLVPIQQFVDPREDLRGSAATSTSPDHHSPSAGNRFAAPSADQLSQRDLRVRRTSATSLDPDARLRDRDLFLLAL